MVLEHELNHHVNQKYPLNDALSHVKVPQHFVCVPAPPLVDRASVHIVPKRCEVSIQERGKDAQHHHETLKRTVENAVCRGDDQIVLEAPLALLLFLFTTTRLVTLFLRGATGTF